MSAERGAELLAFARQRRWFRSKARQVQESRVVDVVALDPFALALLEVTYADAPSERYVVAEPIAARSDALATPELAARLLELIRDPARKHPKLHARRMPGLPSPERPLAPRFSDVEQSNSSIVFGDELLLKVFRALSFGPNPEQELGALLAAKGFAATAPLVGSLEYLAPDRPPATLAILQRFVPNQGDAWTMTLSFLRDFLRSETTPLEPYLARAERLGERTGELHLTLASEADDPAFAPEPFTAADQAALVERARRLCTETFSLLRERLLVLPEAIRPLARRVLERSPAAAFDEEPTPLSMSRIRCHGDYHLGQVLCAGDDFAIIDFEGEPARTLDERRAKRSALVDVAGMLRSFDYARAAALRSAGVDGGPLEARARRFLDGACASFRRGYERVTRSSAFLPEGGGTERLLRLHLLEKAIYELGYELNNRPDWVEIPLSGLEELL